MHVFDTPVKSEVYRAEQNCTRTRENQECEACSFAIAILFLAVSIRHGLYYHDSPHPFVFSLQILEAIDCKDHFSNGESEDDAKEYPWDIRIDAISRTRNISLRHIPSTRISFADIWNAWP